MGPQANEVFTPSTPAKLTFVERELVNNQIVNALRTPGKQIVLYGHSGCGKTTLIVNKLYQIYEDHITVRCTATTKFEEIVLQAFDELDSYYTDSQKKSNSNTLSTKLTADYKLIKSEIGASSSSSVENTFKRIIPPTLTIQTLARFLGNANCCLVLEDFHKVEDSEKKKLSQSMKLFMDMAQEYPSIKIICIGAVGTGREVIQYDQELNNRVAEIHVPLMTDDEIRKIPQLGFPILNIDIPNFLINNIVSISNGVPSVCHSICLHICFELNILTKCSTETLVTENVLKNAVNAYVNDSSDSIQADFEKALEQRKGKFKNAQIIFRALADFDTSGAEYNDLLCKIHNFEPDYPAGNLSNYLKVLSTSEKGDIIQKRASKYCFKTPVYQTYAQCLFTQKHYEEITTATIDLDIKQIQEKIDYLKKKNNLI